MLSKRGLKADAKAAEHIKKYIAHLYKYRNKFFGNARSIRKVVEKAYRNQELRMADLPKDKRTKEMMSTLILADVQEFQPEELNTGRPGLGYKYSS